MEEKVTCVVCKYVIPASEVSQYAAYGRLPSPCCNICFEVNDFSIKDLGELQVRSLIRRFKNSPKSLKQPLSELKIDKYCPAGKINCSHSYINDSNDKCCNPNYTELPVGVGVVVGKTLGFPADEVCRWPSKMEKVTSEKPEGALL